MSYMRVDNNLNPTWDTWLVNILIALLEGLGNILKIIGMILVVTLVITGITLFIRDCANKWFKRVASRGGATIILVVIIYFLFRKTLIEDYTSFHKVLVQKNLLFPDEYEWRSVFNSKGFWTTVKIGVTICFLTFYPIVSYVFYCIIEMKSELSLSWFNFAKWFRPSK